MNPINFTPTLESQRHGTYGANHQPKTPADCCNSCCNKHKDVNVITGRLKNFDIAFLLGLTGAHLLQRLHKVTACYDTNTICSTWCV